MNIYLYPNRLLELSRIYNLDFNKATILEWLLDIYYLLNTLLDRYRFLNPGGRAARCLNLMPNRFLNLLTT